MRIALLSVALAAAALLGAAAPAGAFSINFDGPGSNAEDFAPIGLAIGYGTFVPSLDEFGDPVPGTDHWELDLTAGSVPVLDPSTVGWGDAPSLSKALDARGGPILFVFDITSDITNFSITLDNSPLGDLFNTSIKFYDAAFGEIGSIDVDQSTPGYVASLASVSGVKAILLPPTAFYDNATAGVTPVPEPGTYAVAFAVVGIALIHRMRRKA